MNFKNKYVIAISVLGVIILILLICLLTSKNSNSPILKGSSNPLSIIDYSYVEHDENVLVVEVKNNSSTTYANVEPYVIFYDDNNVPFGFDYGATVNYFYAGSSRYLYFSNPQKKFNKIEIGLFPNKYTDTVYENLYSNITYNIENVVDENGNTRVEISGENKSDKDAYLLYQIGYYADNKLVYISNFDVYADKNSSFADSTYLRNSFYNDDAFPEGYTSKVILSEVFEKPQYTFSSDSNPVEVQEVELDNTEVQEVVENP